MNHETIERDQVIERYLLGQLPAVTAAEFEEHYLDCSSCLEQLELSEAFQSSLKQAVSEDALAAAQRFGVLAWIARLARSPRAGLLAAAALLAVVLPVGYMQRQVSTARQESASLERRLAESRAPQPNVPMLSLSPERGTPVEGPSARLRLPEAEGWVVLALELERPGSDGSAGVDSYRVTLEDSRGVALWQDDGLVPDIRDALSLSLHSSLLEPGDYQLRVAALAGSSTVPVGRFAFRVIAAS